MPNGRKQTDLVKVSNAFNQYFRNVGSRLASKVSPTSKSPTANSVPYSMFLELITEEEVTCYIRSLNDRKSGGGYVRSTQMHRAF